MPFLSEGGKCQLSLAIIKNSFVSDCLLLPCMDAVSFISWLATGASSLPGVFDRAPDEIHTQLVSILHVTGYKSQILT